ncbi:hypothetical protein EST38_g14424 [Candolleomyces aberdarensis]|uniref:JmjC domain-containing protein n=1 Tax=Candolleomyces aberdarensis TaxID=2316362 RepID=A0A4Q2CZP8_9AGAR|nr:hypothetical protein EST38_g14424 [Candolleomyces aberdarensis]
MPKPALKVDNALSPYSSTKSKTVTFYDGKMQPHEYTPFVHDKGDYDAWCAIFEAITPQFVETPDSSLLCCIDESTARQMSVHEFQDILRRRSAIVITNYARERLEFNLEGLGKLADVDHQMDIQDQTLPVLEGNFQCRVFAGTLRDLYKTSIEPPNKKKSLNALFLPNAHALVEETPYATDVHAVHRIAGHDKHCIRQMLTAEIRFSLAATQGAHHYYHIDSRGDGTFIDVVKGEKLWVIAEPKVRKKETSTRQWTKENLDLTCLDPSQWNVEAVLLTEGTRLIMRPGTVHAAFTTADAICRGGHFLATSTMSQTLYGAIHSFFKGQVITNIDQPSIQSRVNAIICYFYKSMVLDKPDLRHPPNISTQHGLEQLLATVCLAELQNVICGLSYLATNEDLFVWRLQEAGISADEALSEYDVSAATYSMRMENVYSRGRAIGLLKAVFARVTIQDSEGNAVEGWSELFIPMLAQLIVALRNYYQMAFENAEGDEGSDTTDEDCQQRDDDLVDFTIPPSSLFYRQLEWTSSRWPELQAAVDRLSLDDDNSSFLAWDFPQITITAVSSPLHSCKKSLPHIGIGL